MRQDDPQRLRTTVARTFALQVRRLRRTLEAAVPRRPLNKAIGLSYHRELLCAEILEREPALSMRVGKDLRFGYRYLKARSQLDLVRNFTPFLRPEKPIRDPAPEIRDIAEPQDVAEV